MQPAPATGLVLCPTDERVAAADALCERQGVRLTALRRDLLEMILDAEGPSTAYQLLDRLRARRGNATPPTVYRTLDFLLAHGLIHRVERLGAFIGCAEGEGHRHPAQFLICTRCRKVTEFDDGALNAALAGVVAALKFSVTSGSIEVEGLCAACR